MTNSNQTSYAKLLIKIQKLTASNANLKKKVKRLKNQLVTKKNKIVK